MYAIVAIGGKQYKVKEGDYIFVEKIDEKSGETITLNNVLMVKKNDEKIIGKPFVEDAKICAKVIEQTRGPKIIVFKKRPKKGYKKTIGHRQNLTKLFVEKIITGEK